MKRILAGLILFGLILMVGCNRQPTTQWNKNQVLFLHNMNRSKDGAGPLHFDPILEKFAQQHAEWMANKNSLTHSNLKVPNSSYMTLGENIAMGYETEESVVQGWMNSPGHRRNILNKRFTHVGFGWATKSNGSPYWCAVFGGR